MASVLFVAGLALQGVLDSFLAGIFAYLWFGANALDAAVALSITLMGLAIAVGLWHLSRMMDPPA